MFTIRHASLAAAAAMVVGLAASAYAAPITTTLSRTNGDTVTDVGITWYSSQGPVTSSTYGSSTNTGTFPLGERASDHRFVRLLIDFDLSSIPTNATIDSATLNLWSGGGINTMPLNAYRLTDSFTSKATWSSRDGTTQWTAWSTSQDQDHVATSSGLATTDVASGTKPRMFDLTSDVQSFVNGTNPNYGWVIVGDENPSATTDDYWNTYISATTQYSGLGTARPQLVVSYSVPEPASAMMLLGGGGLLMLRRRRKQ